MVNKKLLLFILFIFSLFTLQANTFFVKHDAAQGGKGASWNDAFRTIPEALALAASGDQIFVAAGTYTNSWLKSKPGISLYGGFAGTEQNPNERKLSSSLPYDFSNKTIITVKGEAILTSASSLLDAKQFTVDGFVFQDCTNNAPILQLRGGMHLRNCQFIGNILNPADKAPGTNNMFFFNLTAIKGNTEDIHSSIVNCLFENNINHQNQSILGVTSAVDNAYGIVESCIFRNNVTDLASGSSNANILMAGGTKGSVSVRNCHLYNNSSKQAAISSTIVGEFVNCIVNNNDCGTNVVLLAGKMYNSLIVNNSSRFCFNSNHARLYNTAVIGNRVPGFAINKTNITTFEVSNCVTDKKVPTMGVYDAVDILESIDNVHFVQPTSFQGKATNAIEKTEVEKANWNILAISPLLNKGLTKWFTSSKYGLKNNLDNSNKHARYFFELCDINAFESDKHKLTIVVTEGAENPNHTISYEIKGKMIELVVVPLSGYTFKGWVDETNTLISNAETFSYQMPATEKTLTTVFETVGQKYKLTVIAAEGGTVQETSGEYYADKNIQLSAKPNIGYSFDNWSDETNTILSKENNFTFVMPSNNTTITANFILKNDDQAGGNAFDFEGVKVNDQWNTTTGSLILTDLRAQSGTQSLLWNTTAQEDNKLELILESPFITTATKSCYFNIYNPVALIGGKLEVIFYNEADKIVRKATQSMDFIGWREFERSYNLDFEQKSTSDKVARIEFILHNPSSTAGKLYIDRVNLEDISRSNRYLTDWYAPQAALYSDAVLLKNYALISDATLSFTSPTAFELTDLDLIKGHYPIKTKGGNIEEARAYVIALGLSRNSDGSINGKATPLRDCNVIDPSVVKETLKRVETLTHAAQTSITDKTLLNDYLDYILEQDYLYRATTYAMSDYTNIRAIGQLFVNGMKACQNPRQERAWMNLMQWTMSYGHIYRSDYLSDQNSDIIHNMLYTFMPIAANCTDKTVAVRELKGLKRYLERATEITPGSTDLFKPDGSSFHHGTHYPNYMYAFRGWIDAWHTTISTCFRPTKEAYEQFKKAVIALCTLSTRGANGNYLANSLGGRNPFSSGTSLVLNKTYLIKLSKLGGDIYGSTSDVELDQFITYLFDETSSGENFDGFYAYNWSPAGIYRFGNWVATMRAPTTKFWGAEIYSNRNRFGRYQSHGTLEILYNGDNGASGYPITNKDGGWDWNVIPGATTVHYTAWSEMMPGRKLGLRFDQFASTTNFSGALSFEGSGIFASDFIQEDSWGVRLFISTGLKFKKSVFAFDGKLISLGSDITTTASPVNTGITATNLFQSYQPSEGPTINGKRTEEALKAVEYNAGSWILTSQKTGYYVPVGNDNITVFYGEQAAPLDDASDIDSPAKAVVAKAYINHGMKPTNKKYHFVVVPNSDAATMEELVTKIGNNGGELYTINQHDNVLHSLTYKPNKTTAYAFFAPKTGLNFGHVIGAESEMLLMVKEEAENKLSIGVCNPNLRPEGSDTQWKVNPTSTIITLKDIWNLTSGENVTVTHTQENTKIALNLNDGAPQYFELSKTSVGIDDTDDEKAKVWTEKGLLRVVAQDEMTITVYDVMGRSIAISPLATSHSIALPEGIYLLTLQTVDTTEKTKVIIK